MVVETICLFPILIYIIPILIGLSFYLYNWEKRSKWYIITASVILVIALILLLSNLEEFSGCVTYR